MAEGILYDITLIRALERSLSSAFNNPVKLSKKGRENPIREFRVELVDGDSYAHSNKGTEQIVCHIRNGENQPSGFYFRFVATFQRKTFRDYALLHSSLQVFHELHGDCMPLFRAEWDQQATLDPQSDHAQPHWHFVQQPERIEELVRSKMSQSPEFIPYQKGQLFVGYADSGNFHFAMSPLWAKDKACAYKEDFESANFPTWFDNLTKYVAGQIDYIVGKAPSKPAKDFVPEKPSD